MGRFIGGQSPRDVLLADLDHRKCRNRDILSHKLAIPAIKTSPVVQITLIFRSNTEAQCCP